jgi:hypothetical protein
MFNTIIGAGSVRDGAASRYCSGSAQMMRLRLLLHNTSTGTNAQITQRSYLSIFVYLCITLPTHVCINACLYHTRQCQCIFMSMLAFINWHYINLLFLHHRTIMSTHEYVNGRTKSQVYKFVDKVPNEIINSKKVRNISLDLIGSQQELTVVLYPSNLQWSSTIVQISNTGLEDWYCRLI